MGKKPGNVQVLFYQISNDDEEFQTFDVHCESMLSNYSSLCQGHFVLYLW